MQKDNTFFIISNMSGLEEVGVPGPDHLREALTNCTDPLAAIEEFQARMLWDRGKMADSEDGCF